MTWIKSPPNKPMRRPVRPLLIGTVLADPAGAGTVDQNAAGQMKLNSLVPMAYVRSVRQSIEFYRKLRFEEQNTHTPEGGVEPVWAWLKSGGAHLMLAKASEPVDSGNQAVLFYLYCPDVIAFRSMLIEAGVEAGLVQHPFYAPRGEFRVTDPDGHVLMVTHT